VRLDEVKDGLSLVSVAADENSPSLWSSCCLTEAVVAKLLLFRTNFTHTRNLNDLLTEFCCRYVKTENQED